ncbi:MAG TPA: hypothetical protein VJG83_03935 [archaeon]|nr:hypothetical protein [archaeon]
MQSKLLAILLFSLLIAFGGCAQKKTPYEGPGATDVNAADQNALIKAQEAIVDANTVSETDICLREQNAVKADECLIELGKTNKRSDPCEKISVLPKDTCFLEVGIAAEDEITCGKISDQSIKDKCFSQIAVESGRIELCRKIGAIESRDECLGELANTKSSIKECLSIFDIPTKDSCIVTAAAKITDKSICENVSKRLTKEGYSRDLCYYANSKLPMGQECVVLISPGLVPKCFLEADGNFTKEVDCNALSDVNSQNSCTAWLGFAKKEVSYCYALPKKEQDACVERVISAKPQKTECPKIKGLQLENDCYMQAAVSYKDISACQQIDSNPILRNGCIAALALELEDPQSCALIPANNISGRDECYSGLALATNDYRICESVQTDKQYISCFSDIALGLGATEVCTKPQRESLRLLPYAASDYCIEEYAISIEDAKLCDKISKSALQEHCNQEVGKRLACIDNDDVCDEGICDYKIDSDCKSPFSCTVDSECNDNKAATKNSCVNDLCKYTQITQCIADDSYCPGICTYTGDPNKTTNAQGETNEDSDCESP